MLTYMIIRNFAIIDALEVEFREGFTAITGETGAGKSILMNALNLLLGGRANTDIVRADTDGAVVEGTFALDPEKRALVAEALGQEGIEVGDELIIRRTVSAKGSRNRVFINGSVVPLATLREVTRGLVDISGQHEHYSLLDTAGHVGVLDRFGGLRAQADALAKQIARWHELRREATRLRNSERERLSRIDFLRFQIRELDDHWLSPDDQAQMAEEAALLRHATTLREKTFHIAQQLSEGDHCLCDGLGELTAGLRRLVKLDARLEPLVELCEQADALLSEAGSGLRNYQRHIQVNPERLEELDDLLNAHHELTRKYGEDHGDCMAQLDAMRAELAQLQGASHRIDEAEREHERLRDVVFKEAVALSKRRAETAQRLQAAIEAELKGLGMERCRFTVQRHYALPDSGEPTEDISRCTPDSLNARGLDHVEFLLCPNPGEGFKPLARIASGGELSRIMLALKSALMASDPVPTYIFDEIDTGIGGQTAVAVGEKIQAVSRRKQVISITHLAQIAAFARNHFKVAKVLADNRTVSTVTPLSDAERAEEVARMLGGMSPKTLEHAQEMLSRAASPP
jgi:DNA repair protein RecN (Recombination protein N)